RSADRLGLHLAVQPHGPAGGIDPVRLDDRWAAAGVATGGPARRRRPGAARGRGARGTGAVVRPAARGITMSACRVGASLAGGSPPGTVRAPLDAYGSTSDTAEGHILQRGVAALPPVPGVQRLMRPPQYQAEVAPVIVTAHLPGRDVVDLDCR